jgi:hypothetical protein
VVHEASQFTPGGDTFQDSHRESAKLELERELAITGQSARGRVLQLPSFGFRVDFGKPEVISCCQSLAGISRERSALRDVRGFPAELSGKR